jgi:hypothetical protein
MSDTKPQDILPIDPQAFWSAGPAPALRGTDRTPQELPLRRLGPSPFPRSGFPVLGLLETAYEHVIETTQARTLRPLDPI